VKVKIVTDSTADMPAAIIKELDVAVVPEYVLFGDQVLRDHIDINEDEFYQRLLNAPVHPKTSQPTPQDFASVYSICAREADAIISIHLSSKLSGTYSSAVQGKNMINTGCQIEIIDSQTVSIALGLAVIQAAKTAKSGMDLKSIVNELRQIMTKVHILMLLDTLKYLAKGGRIGKAKALLGSLLNIKPLLIVKDGELVPSNQVRTRSKGIDLLLDFVKNAGEIEDLAVLHSTTPDEALALAERLSSIFPKERIILSRLGPALGVHGGPGVLAIAMRQKGHT
jgi:DegV family protein with EDD domain